jgi:hypothetical protein
VDRKWFHKFGFLYVTVSLTGWTLTLLTGFTAVRTFLMVDRYSHSASDTLIGPDYCNVVSSSLAGRGTPEIQIRTRPYLGAIRLSQINVQHPRG